MHSNGRQSLDAFLLRVVDGSLAGVIFLVPFLMGGRHAIGQLVLTILAVAAAWAWAVRQSLRNDATWRPAVATPLVLIGLLLVVLQTVPLPSWLLAHLAPSSTALLPQWNGDTAPGLFGRWPCISFAPAETLAGLVIFLDLAMLFFVVVQRVQRVEDVERLLRWCALSAVAMAFFGIVQLLAGNGKFFWFYEHPYSKVDSVAKGSFTNRNHFAQFLALGTGPLIWWLQDAMRRLRGRGDKASVSVGLLSLSLGVVLFAGLLSLSRGGIMAMSLAAALCTAICYRSTSLGRRFIAVLGGAGALIVLSLSIFGYDRVSNRIEDLSSGSLDRLDNSASRRTIWTTTVKATLAQPLLGTGVGSFSEVYPVYAGTPAGDDRSPTHAENGYLQVSSETGLVGLGLVLAGMVLCASWCIGGVRASVPTRAKACAAAIAGSLAASAVHALVDFVWYVPACMAIVVVLAACALRVRQTSGEEARQKTKGKRQKAAYRFPDSSPLASPLRLSLSWPAAVVALTTAGGWMIADRVGPAVAQTYWDEYLVARHAAEAQDPSGPNCALSDAKTQERWIACLEKVLHWQPTHIQAHLKLVETHRQLFDLLQRKSENPMSLIQIGDAVFREPQFRSREALMEWLPRAIGPHWVHLKQCLAHARQALALCPLEGRGYVHVAELSLLWASDRTAGRACIEQAMRVRPFDGDVLYAAGNEALLAGDEPTWREHLKRAYRCGRRQQQQILSDRVAGTPQELLPLVVADILREFQPDLLNARFLYNLCKDRCSSEQLTPLVVYLADAAETQATAMNNAEAVEVWIEAYLFRSQLHDETAALRCVRGAVQCDPSNHNARYHLGLCLLRQSQFTEAESHLRWCLQRTPDNQALEDSVKEAFKGRLDDQRRAGNENTRSMSR
jgi:O-antigen ligase/tetratricopeptide (TPR) repeat protein